MSGPPGIRDLAALGPRPRHPHGPKPPPQNLATGMRVAGTRQGRSHPTGYLALQWLVIATSCPQSGRFLVVGPIGVHHRRVPDGDLVARVAGSTGLSETEAARVIGDVLAHYAEPVEDFVRRRHAALQLHGTRNPVIYRTIAAELSQRLVAAPALTERQVRRMIYG
jgi:hypothetical protein